MAADFAGKGARLRNIVIRKEVRTRRKPVLMRELNIFPAIHVISLWGKTSLLSILVKLLLNKISKTYLL